MKIERIKNASVSKGLGKVGEIKILRADRRVTPSMGGYECARKNCNGDSEKEVHRWWWLVVGETGRHDSEKENSCKASDTKIIVGSRQA